MTLPHPTLPDPGLADPVVPGPVFPGRAPAGLDTPAPRPKRPTPSQQRRSAEAAEAMALHVEVIAQMAADTGEARMAGFARRLDLTSTSATKAVRRLQRAGLATHAAYSPIVLTEAGYALVAASRDRRARVHDVLVALGVSPATAWADAAVLERRLSEESLCALARLSRGAGPD